MSGEPTIKGLRTSEYHASYARIVREQLMAIAQRITVDLLMTPIADLTCVPADATVAEAVQRMKTRFDQAPVLQEDILLGLVFRDAMTQAISTDPVLAHAKPVEQIARVPSNAFLGTAAELLAEHPCVIVVEPDRNEWCGLLHFSDLNKHAVRSNVYLWVSALEISLASLIHRFCPDWHEWLRVLDERRQVMIIGRYEYERRQGVELDPVEGTDLSDLLKIAKSVPKVIESLGYSKSQFDKKTGHLVRVRNAAMHPVRTLVREHGEVRRILGFTQDLMEILDAVENSMKADEASPKPQ